MPIYSSEDAELAVPRITVGEIMALPIADYVKYMRLNKGPTGELVLSAVDGLEELSNEEREQFGQKTIRLVATSVQPSFSPFVTNGLTALVKFSPSRTRMSARSARSTLASSPVC